MTKNQAHVKEVQSVIDLGLSEQDARKLFDGITDEFNKIYGMVEANQFHTRVGELQKNDLREFRRIIDEVAGDYGLTWREVKYNPHRVKRCEVCQSWFYVMERNGKTLTCERFGTFRRFDLTKREYYYWHKDGRKLSECAVKYELSNRPPTVRNVQEELFDPAPGSEDVKGNVFLDRVEDAYQERINPHYNEWTYWQR